MSLRKVTKLRAGRQPPHMLAACLHSFAKDLSTFRKAIRPENLRLLRGFEAAESVLPLFSSLLRNKSKYFEDITVRSVVQCRKLHLDEPRCTDNSWLEVNLPLSTHEGLRDLLMKIDGATVRYAPLFEILDALAADVAFHHCGGKRFVGHTIVTACVDGVRAAPINVFTDLKLQGYISYVGNSSMEVNIDMVTADSDDSLKIVGSMFFTMVSRNEETKKGEPVPRLLIETEDDKLREESAKERVARRKQQTSVSLSLKPPLPSEVELMHNLYLKSSEVMQSTESSSLSSIPRNYKWMRDTCLKNTLFMAPQQRNQNGKMFGGYLMRVAYDLAWTTALTFFGHTAPDNDSNGVSDNTSGNGSANASSSSSTKQLDVKLRAVDDIQFVRPAEVGDVLEFEAQAIYVEDMRVAIKVTAKKRDFLTGSETLTTMFVYVFENVTCDSTSEAVSNAQSSLQIMPEGYREFLLYLEGRRAMQRLENIA